MNRKQFLCNLSGAIAATVIGSKLNLVPIPQTDTTLPGIGGQTFKLFIPLGAFHPNDIVSVGNGNQYWLDNNLLGHSVTGDHQIQFIEQINGVSQEEKVIRMYSTDFEQT